MPNQHQTILDLIGNTPLVRIQNITKSLPKNIQILAKLERYNPGGSVKDALPYWMVKDGIKSGKLTKNKVIFDSTSGNTGIALAMIGAAMGYKVQLVMPANVSEERKRIIQAFGADIIFSDPLEGSDGAILLARKLYDENPSLYFKPDQYNNPKNPQAHEESTGPEIWRDTDQKVTHFIASIGTSGTLMGTGRYLKKQSQNIQIIAAEPDSPFHGIEGLKHMESSIIPGIYHEDGYDTKLGITTEDAYEYTQRLAVEEGLLCGQSCGCALVAAIKVAKELAQNNQAGTIVCIFPDGGEKYLSTPVFADGTVFKVKAFNLQNLLRYQAT